MFSFLKANPTHQTMPHSSLLVVVTHTIFVAGCASSGGHLRERGGLPHYQNATPSSPSKTQNANPTHILLGACCTSVWWLLERT